MLLKVKLNAEVLVMCPNFDMQKDGNTEEAAQFILLQAEQHLNKIGMFETESGLKVGVRVHFQEHITSG